LSLLLLLLLAGSDHRLAAWDATSFAEVWRTKLDAKSPATSLAYSHRCGTLACLLLACLLTCLPTAVGCWLLLAVIAQQWECPSLSCLNPSITSTTTHPPCCQLVLLWLTQPLCRYFNLSGAHALLATVNGPGVVAAFTLANMPPERGLRACANLAGLVPPGGHKSFCCSGG
jgi:hypothetical protein